MMSFSVHLNGIPRILIDRLCFLLSLLSGVFASGISSSESLESDELLSDSSLSSSETSEESEEFSSADS